MPTLTITLSNVGTMTFNDDKNVEIVSVKSGEHDLTEFCVGDCFIPTANSTMVIGCSPIIIEGESNHSLTLGGVQMFNLGYNSKKKRLSWKIAQDVNVCVKIKADAPATV